MYFIAVCANDVTKFNARNSVGGGSVEIDIPVFVITNSDHGKLLPEVIAKLLKKWKTQIDNELHEDSMNEFIAWLELLGEGYYAPSTWFSLVQLPVYEVNNG